MYALYLLPHLPHTCVYPCPQRGGGQSERAADEKQYRLALAEREPNAVEQHIPRTDNILMDEIKPRAHIAEKHRDAVGEQPGDEPLAHGEKIHRRRRERQEKHRRAKLPQREEAVPGLEYPHCEREKDGTGKLQRGGRAAALARAGTSGDEDIPEVAANGKVDRAHGRENISEPEREAGVVLPVQRAAQRRGERAQPDLHGEERGTRGECRFARAVGAYTGEYVWEEKIQQHRHREIPRHAVEREGVFRQPRLHQEKIRRGLGDDEAVGHAG